MSIQKAQNNVSRFKDENGQIWLVAAKVTDETATYYLVQRVVDNLKGVWSQSIDEPSQTAQAEALKELVRQHKIFNHKFSQEKISFLPVVDTDACEPKKSTENVPGSEEAKSHTPQFEEGALKADHFKTEHFNSVFGAFSAIPPQLYEIKIEQDGFAIPANDYCHRLYSTPALNPYFLSGNLELELNQISEHAKYKINAAEEVQRKHVLGFEVFEKNELLNLKKEKIKFANNAKEAEINSVHYDILNAQRRLARWIDNLKGAHGRCLKENAGSLDLSSIQGCINDFIVKKDLISLETALDDIHQNPHKFNDYFPGLIELCNNNNDIWFYLDLNKSIWTYGECRIGEAGNKKTFCYAYHNQSKVVLFLPPNRGILWWSTEIKGVLDSAVNPILDYASASAKTKGIHDKYDSQITAIENEFSQALKAVQDKYHPEQVDLEAQRNKEMAAAGGNEDEIKRINKKYDDQIEALKDKQKVEAKAITEEMEARITTLINLAKDKQNVVQSHAHVSQALEALETIAINLGYPGAFKKLRLANLGQQAAMNIHLLGLELAHVLKVIQKGGIASLTAANGWGLILPSLQVMSLISSAIALLTGKGQMEPVTQEFFIEVLNKHLLPYLSKMHESLAQGQESLARGQRLLAELTEKQTQILVKTMKSYTEDLQQALERYNKESHARFDNQDFNAFIVKSQERVRNYRNNISSETRFLKQIEQLKNEKLSPNTKQHISSEIDRWLTDGKQTYSQRTKDALKDSKENLAHGFTGTAFIFPLEKTGQAPIYTTGILHHKTGLMQNGIFPADLVLLDSIVYTHIRLVRALLINKDLSKGTLKLSVAEDLLFEVEAQRKLFAHLPVLLDQLIESHAQLMLALQTGKTKVAEARQKTVADAQEWLLDDKNKANILNNLVGQKMYRITWLVSTPLNLNRACRDKITTFICANKKFLAFEDWRTERLLQLDAKMCSFGTLGDLPEALDYADQVEIANPLFGPRLARNPLSRRIWGAADSKYTSIATLSLSPLGFSSSTKSSEVNVVTTLSDVPIVDCTFEYDLQDSKLKTRFSDSSRVRSEDIHKIPRLDGNTALYRKARMEKLLAALASGNSAFNQFCEVCHPYNDPALPVIFLPKNLLEGLKKAWNSNSDQLELAGQMIGFKYSFQKSTSGDQYQLNLHAVIGSDAVLSDLSYCICKVDSVTVESYSKHYHHPNLTEFLYCFLFPSDENSEGIDGIPDATTYVRSGERGFIAPGATKFPGLIKILEKKPDTCLIFDHKLYNNETYEKFKKLVETGEFDNGLQRFFVSSYSAHYNLHCFVEIQSLISQILKELKTSLLYKTFEEKYILFTSLAKLTTDLSPASIKQGFRSKTGIIPPGESGSLEQAHYYTKPEEKELGLLKDTLMDNPSLAKQRLDLYASELQTIIDVFKEVESLVDSKSYTFEKQVQFAEKIKLLNPRKKRAHLEEDAKKVFVQNNPETFTPSTTTEATTTSNRDRITPLDDNFGFRTFPTKGYQSCGLHAFLGELVDNVYVLAEVNAERKKIADMLRQRRQEKSLPEFFQLNLTDYLLFPNKAPKNFRESQIVRDAVNKIKPYHEAWVQNNCDATWDKYIFEMEQILDRDDQFFEHYLKEVWENASQDLLINELNTAAFLHNKQILFIQPEPFGEDKGKMKYGIACENKGFKEADLNAIYESKAYIPIYYNGVNHFERAELLRR